MRGDRLEGNILIEDDLVDAIIVRRALREFSVANHLVHCRNSKEALTYLQTGDNEKACFILLDLNMPGMSGFGFLGSLKEHEQLREIPVMIVSTPSRREYFAKSQGLGAAGYIVKLSNYREFVNKFRAVEQFSEVRIERRDSADPGPMVKST